MGMMGMLSAGKQLYCQTPNKWFPIEPHILTLFVHWFSFSVKRRLARYFSISELIAKPSQKEIDEVLQRRLNLLSGSEFAAISPGCIMRKEKVLGLTKSFIVERIQGFIRMPRIATDADPIRFLIPVVCGDVFPCLA
ncbi:MAG: hypothetical protein ABI271_08285 [Nitrosospira sp.]